MLLATLPDLLVWSGLEPVWLVSVMQQMCNGLAFCCYAMTYSTF